MIGPVLAVIKNEARRIWCFRRLVVAVTVLTWCGAAVLIRLMPDTYDAWGQIYVAPQTPLVNAAEGVSLVGNGYGSPYVALTTLLNDDSLEKIVKRIDPDAARKGRVELAMAVADLRSKIRRAPDPGEGFIELHVADTDPVRARDIVRLLMDQFIQTNIGRSQRDLHRAGAFLDEQIAAYDSMLKGSQEKIAAFRASHPQVTAIALQQREPVFATTQVDAPSFQSGGVEPIAALQPPPPTPAEARVAELQTRIATLLIGYTEKHPDVVAARRELADAIAARDAERASAAATPAAPTPAPAARPALVFRRAVRPAAPPPLPPDVAATWVDLQKTDEVLRTNYQQLLAKRAATRMSQAVYQDDEAGKYQIVREPVVPQIPAGPNRMLYLALAAVAAVGSGVGAGYLRAAFAGILVSRQELEDAFQLPVIGTVSWESAWHEPRTPQTRMGRMAARLPPWLQPRRVS
jgi:uncharacterized protein involved in exopolysaccharide biosynthesis